MRRTVLALGAVVLAVLVPLSLGPSASARDTYPVTYNFTHSALLAGTQVDADPPGANDWSCKPSRGHPRPVVLVHGTAGNKNTNWQTYAPLLANHGYCVFALTYGVNPGTPKGPDQLGGMDDMRVSARQLAGFVAKVRRATGARKVDILGHSQGTLMPNWYVKFLGGARYVERYISLAPLWHGSDVGEQSLLHQVLGQFNSQGYDVPFCTACGQMAPDSAFLHKMRRGRVAVRGVSYTNIMTRHDELVQPWTSGIEKGMRNIVVQDRCATDYTEHFEIASDPVAAGYVLNALDPKHPSPVPCTVVLPFEGPVPGFRP